MICYETYIAVFLFHIMTFKVLALFVEQFYMFIEFRTVKMLGQQR